MDDARVWEFEESLWKRTGDDYAAPLDPEYVLVVPAPPYIAHGAEAETALAKTPAWDAVEFSDQIIARPQEGLIVVAYRIMATKGEETYDARCSSVHRRLAHDDWRVVQHQQTPVLAD